jgi:hypothetical protein
LIFRNSEHWRLSKSLNPKIRNQKSLGWDC